MTRMMRRPTGRAGQSIAEFALVLPILAVILASILEFGLAFDADLAIEAASREGVRAGASLGNGGSNGVCPFGTVDDASAGIDAQILKTIKASLTSAGLDMGGVGVLIYLAAANGNPTAGKTNTFTWNGAGFTKTSGSWTACGRHDGTFGGGIYDGIGVQITYTYVTKTGILTFLGGHINMVAQTVMPIGPPWH